MTDKLRDAAQQALEALDNMTDSQSNPARRNFPTIHDYGKSRRAADALRAALSQHSVYQLPDDLYPDSKCWVDGTYAERVEWLHTMYESSKQTLNVLLGQRDAQAVPQGWKLVPVEPTPEMCNPSGDVGIVAEMAARYRREIWESMLNAAPTPPAQEKQS